MASGKRGLVPLLLAVMLTTSGCALFQPEYPGINPNDEFTSYSANRDMILDAYEDMGVSPTARLSNEERENVLMRSRLLRMERNIVSAREREQYFKYRPHIESDEEKMVFLQLPSLEARDQYAMAKGFYFQAGRYPAAVRDAITTNDIVLGMTKEAVIQSWGDPEVVEVAGNPVYGNERWKYVEFVTSTEGFQREERIIYFRSGKVAGWEKAKDEE